MAVTTWTTTARTAPRASTTHRSALRSGAPCAMAGRSRHRPRRQRPGRTAGREQGARCARRAVQRPVHGPHGACPQQRQRAQHRCARGRGQGLAEEILAIFLDDPVRGRPAPAARRPDQRDRGRRSTPICPPGSRTSQRLASSRARRHEETTPMPWPSDLEPDDEVFDLIDREVVASRRASS